MADFAAWDLRKTQQASGAYQSARRKELTTAGAIKAQEPTDIPIFTDFLAQC